MDKLEPSPKAAMKWLATTGCPKLRANEELHGPSGEPPAQVGFAWCVEHVRGGN